MQKTQVQLLGLEDPLKKEMATRSSILAWEIPCIDTGDCPWGHKQTNKQKLELLLFLLLFALTFYVNILFKTLKFNKTVAAFCFYSHRCDF